ncbi:D-alanine--poly(phosphoribitol) ligase subunit DltA [Oenococcus sicerae]|uniref:D-alanine--D-alanyl carrier protein ligase n=1 Tax=Oenococcus sicerae TaxID=2203724 RepID=A0AAJ1R9J2_9LACO|nr:D-alanine--poly(phosphoribitol) ligase subunit DltA [Oenococcus sicerae]MDN6900257.1 D-alanine--poly(phosphoribitol) ligase subunit 1 [Oenococcus sicerae]
MIKNLLATINQNTINDPQAVVYDNLGKQNTYADLKANSDALAAYIDGLKIADKTPIMVYTGQEFDTIVSFLAAVKSGHAYIPVDVNSSDERLTDILKIADPAAVIAVDQLPIKIADRPVISATDLQTIFQDPQPYEQTHAVSGDDIFYIIFTSGTTGLPKGVQISSNNLLSFVNWMLDAQFDLPQKSVTLAQAPFSFDLSVMDWAPTLAVGGQLKAVSKELADNFKQLFETLPKLGLQLFVSTPSFADLCLINPAFNQENLPQLSRFLFCGEELTKKTATILRARFPEAKIFNTYGPTETTVAVSAIEMTDHVLESCDRLPIGYAKADTEIVIFNEQNQQLAANQMGEIIIAGASVSKGYLNNPAKTETAFFTYQGRQAYHTGDLGSLDEKGLLHYGGRKDFQIKLHGYRIELEEVSHGLMQSQLVKQAVAVPRYDENHKVAQLLAWVVAQPNDFVRTNDLTKALKADLKDVMMPYMVPSRFVYKESLPISANGKIDLKKVIAEVNNG